MHEKIKHNVTFNIKHLKHFKQLANITFMFTFSSFPFQVKTNFLSPLKRLLLFFYNSTHFTSSFGELFGDCDSGTLRKKCPYSDFSGPDFPAFVLNTEIYSVNPRILSKCRKIQTRETPNTDTFCAVIFNFEVDEYLSWKKHIKYTEI